MVKFDTKFTISRERQMNFVSKTSQAQGHTDEQWQARIDLAAAHRCAVMHDLHEGIFNHLTFRVPGHDDRYWQDSITIQPVNPVAPWGALSAMPQQTIPATTQATHNINAKSRINTR